MDPSPQRARRAGRALAAVTTPIGVGFLGAGPATQAIHVPTLSTFGDRFKIVKVMDLDGSLARTIADRVGATATTNADELLNDPAVDVVAVNSPNAFHVDQVIAACAAGKRAILCEKPLALTTDDAARIATASATSEVPIVVGTMHAYDPAVVAAFDAWAEVGEQAHFTRSSIYLPRNRVFASAASNIRVPPEVTPPSPHPGEPTIRDVILGLAIHAVPLVRRLLPTFDDVAIGRYLRPVGYFVTARSGPWTAQMIGLMPTQWRPVWTLQAVSDQHELTISFPPSYVLAGSASAELSGPDGTRRWRFATNGYQAEWSEIEAIVGRGAPPRFTMTNAVDDLAYALKLIEGSDREPERV